MSLKNIEKLISKHNRRLQKLKEQQASSGIDTRPHILIEIEDIEAALEELQTELKASDNSDFIEEATSELVDNSRSRVQIYISDDFSSVSAERQSAAIDAFAAAMRIPPQSIEIYRVYKGSVVFDLGIPPRAVQRLRSRLQSNSAQLRLSKVERVVLESQLGEIEEWIIKDGSYQLVTDVSAPDIEKLQGTTDNKSVRLGLISTAFGVESTQSEFYFWADRSSVLESGQIVYARQSLPLNNNLGITEMTVYGVIEKVNRLSSSRSIEADMRERDGDAGQQRLWPRGSGTERTGTTYAYCRVIGIEPNILTPLHEDTEVFLAGEQEAGQGYGYPEMLDNYSALSVGLLLNGGITTAGKACLDTRYILGEYGGHINVTGKAGTATKTSFLLNIIKHLMLFAEDTIKRGDELYVVPIVFNAKGSDLMWIGYKNKKFSPDASDWLAYKQAWGEEYWGRYATSFNDVQLYSYPVSSDVVRTNLPANTKPYNWSLKDVIEWGTWRYLFSGEDRSHELLMGLMYDIFQHVSKRDNKTMSGFTLDQSKVLNFDSLVDWVNSATGDDDQHYLRERSHSPLTIEAAVRRFRNTLNGNPVLLKDAATGQPPIFARVGNFGPIVIDIDGLPPGAQRFIVASIIEYLKIDRRNNAGKKQVYVLMLDELNQYAGRNNRDEVARLFEHVAAQLRSQGIILFGAQQKASDVIEIVFENSATKVLGNTGSGEIGQSIWTRELSTDVRARALQLRKEEKLVLQDGFRYPMALKFPLSPWATKEGDARVVDEEAFLNEEQEL